MVDERTYGFSADDAQSLIQSISHGESMYPEIRPRGTGGGSAGSDRCCSMHLLPDVVNTFFPTENQLTRRFWHVSDACTAGPLAAIKKNITAVGTLVWPGGNPILTLDDATGEWKQDVSDTLVLYDANNNDITSSASSISGIWKRIVDLDGDDKVTLTMSAAL